MSDTPRTNNIFDEYRIDACSLSFVEGEVMELERELNAANARVAELESRLEPREPIDFDPYDPV